MPVCPGLKRDGARCTMIVSGSNDYCYQHDPARAHERRRNASKAARSKPTRELTEIKRLLSELTDRVLGKEGTEALGTGPATVANQLINTRLRALDLECKIRESDDIQARLEDLKSALSSLDRLGPAAPHGRASWGA